MPGLPLLDNAATRSHLHRRASRSCWQRHLEGARTAGRFAYRRDKAELDLLDGAAVQRFFAEEKPDYVFVAAAKVGGILANDTFPAEFLHQNLQIQSHLIHGAYQSGVKKAPFPGQFLELSQTCSPTNQGNILTERPA